MFDEPQQGADRLLPAALELVGVAGDERQAAPGYRVRTRHDSWVAGVESGAAIGHLDRDVDCGAAVVGDEATMKQGAGQSPG